MIFHQVAPVRDYTRLRAFEIEKIFVQAVIDLKQILVLDGIDQVGDDPGFRLRAHDLYGPSSYTWSSFMLASRTSAPRSGTGMPSGIPHGHDLCGTRIFPAPAHVFPSSTCNWQQIKMPTSVISVDAFKHSLFISPPQNKYTQYASMEPCMRRKMLSQQDRSRTWDTSDRNTWVDCASLLSLSRTSKVPHSFQPNPPAG